MQATLYVRSKTQIEQITVPNTTHGVPFLPAKGDRVSIRGVVCVVQDIVWDYDNKTITVLANA